MCKDSGVVEVVIDRASRNICPGRKRPAYVSKLITFEDVANLAKFVAIRSVLKTASPVTPFISGNFYTGIHWLNFLGRAGRKRLDIDGQLQAVYNLG